MKSKLNPTYTLLIIIVAILAGISQGGKLLRNHLNAATVPLKLETIGANDQAQNNKNALPLITAKDPAPTTPTAPVTNTISAPALAQLFRTAASATAPTNNAPITEPPPKAIDYFSLLRQHVRLDGTTQHGAIINGAYLPIGDPIDQFAYPTNPTNTAKTFPPRLIATTATTATIQEAHGKRTLIFQMD